MYYLGNVSEMQGEQQHAKEWYEKAIAADVDLAPAYNDLGLLYFSEGNIAKALQQYQSAIKKDFKDALFVSAKNKKGIEILKNKLLEFVNTKQLSNNATIITNLRHYEELQLTLHEINTIIEGLDNGLTGDFLAINIRQALFHLGSITGEVSTDDLLSNIFSKFCIGK